MIYVAYAINFSFIIGFPIALAIWLNRRWGVGWRLWLIGAATFFLSQVGHIPFNALVQKIWPIAPEDLSQTGTLFAYALFLGLSAGVFEEGSRYLAYRFWATDARSWRTGFMMGAGHGGFEAVFLVGILGGITVAVYALLPMEQLLANVPPEQAQAVQAQIEGVFNTPWYNVFLGSLERVFAVCAHIALSLLVLQVFTRKQTYWLFLAIAWHALLDFFAVFASTRWGVYATEGIVGVIALLSVGIIYALYAPEPVEPEPEPLPEVQTAVGLTLQTSDTSMDNSRYQE